MFNNFDLLTFIQMKKFELDQVKGICIHQFIHVVKMTISVRITFKSIYRWQIQGH